jgi:hypothetical protein
MLKESRLVVWKVKKRSGRSDVRMLDLEVEGWQVCLSKGGISWYAASPYLDIDTRLVAYMQSDESHKLQCL